jgi:hypothetical protein
MAITVGSVSGGGQTHFFGLQTQRGALSTAFARAGGRAYSPMHASAERGSFAA